MRKVFIIGHGLTKVGEQWEASLESLLAESALLSMKSSGVSRVDEIFVANAFGEILQEQSNLGAVLAEELGMSGTPALRVEAGSASGACAIRAGMISIQSGVSNVVLVTGAEKMSDSVAEEALWLSSMEERQEYAGQVGGFPGASAALLYKQYMKRYSARQEGVAYFAVLGHTNAVNVPHAQYPFKVSLETVLSSPTVADPLRRLETASVADGSASVVLCGEEVASKLDVQKSRLLACTLATDYLTAFDREDPLHLQALSRATQEAISMSGLERGQIGAIELHDSFTILAALSLESSGFTPKGKAGELAYQGKLALDGELPVNTFGGLKARGYPVGATAIYQLAESHMQLTGQAGKNQLDGLRAVMTQSLAGVGATASVSILEAA